MIIYYFRPTVSDAMQVASNSLCTDVCLSSECDIHNIVLYHSAVSSVCNNSNSTSSSENVPGLQTTIFIFAVVVVSLSLTPSVKCSVFYIHLPISYGVDPSNHMFTIWQYIWKALKNIYISSIVALIQ